MAITLVAAHNLPPDLAQHENQVYPLHRMLDDGACLVMTKMGLLMLHRIEWVWWVGSELKG